jgi:hypothetical protein
MGSPRLSPTQWAYLFHREAFLERLCRRALRLAEDGYTVQATETPCVFLVVCPAGVNAYTVHALEKTCTCPFYTKQAHDEPLTADGARIACKHLLGLKTLLRKTRERLLRDGAECEAYRLWAQTMAWLAVERLRTRDEATTTPKGEEGDELFRCAGPGSGR